MIGRRTIRQSRRGLADMHASGAGVWTPASRGSQLFLWFEADYGITLNGATVSQWNDRANGHNLTQATSARQPSYNASDTAYNGHPTVQLTAASSQWMVTPSFSQVEPGTMYVVAETSLGAAQGQLVEGIAGGGRWVFYWNAGQVWAVAEGGGGNVFGNGTKTKQVMAGVLNAASSAIYQNNSQTPVATGSLTTTTWGGMGLGSFNSGANFFSGKVAAIIVTNVSDTAAQRLKMFQYLGNKYAVGVS